MRGYSIGHKQLISQCLSMLPTENFSDPLVNYEYNKLSVDALMKVFVAAQLDKWESYADMEEKLQANPEFCESIGLESISASQLSRRINDLPTKWAQTLFEKVVRILQDLTQDCKGVNSRIGRLSIIDSTHLKLPPQLCEWAYVTKGWNVVKMHTRIAVVSEDTSYPDKMVPSTGNVGDVETPDCLVEQLYSTYLMDRGYPSIKNLRSWQDQNIQFVVRVTKNFRIIPMETYSTSHPSILQDAKARYSHAKEPVRLVEFLDEEGKRYRLLTTRWDLSAEEIMDLYRYRWMIETFFKWIKQHLRFVKIWSTTPQGIWNQLFLALIAYCLALIFQLKTKTTRTLWEFLRLMRTYMFKPYEVFIKALNAKKSKTSRGRQKIPIPKQRGTPFKGNVAIIKEQKRKN
ncbi:IS4 family transposase [Sediminibacillus sp. JSM 1682029]|uniref:IS4 family transposase n=1 Tax=Sediminibacillus sp. JSM 1682029 TaxID=3229857 RepID=UPI0035268281